MGKSYDIYVTKYDPCGNERWSRAIDGGSALGDASTGISADSEGNVYVTGNFRRFREGHWPYQSEYGVILKYDTCGGEIWSQEFGENVTTSAVALDPFGNLYAGGLEFIRPPPYWLSKFSTADGSPAPPPWQRVSGLIGRWIDGASGMVTDAGGNIYLLGNSDGDNFWIRKSTPDGVPDPAFGTNGVVVFDSGLAEWGYDITIGPDGALYVVGNTHSRRVLGENLWIGKFDSATGEFLRDPPFPLEHPRMWTRSIALDDAGNIYVTGVLFSRAWGDNWHLFVRKYTTAGRVLWTDIADVDFTEGMGIAVGSDRNIYVTGLRTDEVDFFRSHIWIRKYTSSGFSDDGPPDFFGDDGP